MLIGQILVHVPHREQAFEFPTSTCRLGTRSNRLTWVLADTIGLIQQPRWQKPRRPNTSTKTDMNATTGM
jgi:hypothetical protein